MKMVSKHLLFVLALLAFLTVAFSNSNKLNAQDFGAFSGRGIPNFSQPEPQPQKFRWPKLLDFSKNDSEFPAQTARPFSSLFKKPNFQLFKQRPNWLGDGEAIRPLSGLADLMSGGPDSPRPFSGFADLMNNPDAPKPFSGLADLIPKRDPSKPGLLAQMNAKSKSFFDRTLDRSNWGLSKAAEGAKEKTFGTWDAITRDMRAIQQNQSPITPTTPALPNIRTAETDDTKPRIRF